MAGKRRVFSLPVSVREVRSVPPTNEITRTTTAATPSTEPTGIPISSLPVADTPGNSDVVPGVQSGTTKKYSFATLFSWILGQITPAVIGAVPTSRTVNNKALSQDITLTSSDVGARADTWMPSASDVGAQPTISANGILKGDGQGGVAAAVAGTDFQAPLAIDTTPTANSTNPVQSGGVYTDVRTRVPVYGMGQNLLRNWYFVGGGSQQGGGQLPINQRGQTSYQTTEAYGIDGWRMVQWNTTARAITVNSGNVELTGSASGACSLLIWQNIENGVKLAGKTVTVSVLCGASATGRLFVRGDMYGDIYGHISLVPSGLRKYTLTLPDSITGVSIAIGQNGSLGGSGNTDIQLLAVKLELGTEQTLAHQENGVWVLNEIPDYEYELYRCITSTADSSDTYANKTLATGQDLTNIQATGTTNTTGAVIPAGAYFYLNGILYRAKEQIGTNVPFTVNTNCEQATISKMAEYWLDVTSQFSTVSGATLKVLVNPTIRKVKLFFLADSLSNGSVGVTIPTQYAPDTAKLVYVSSTDSYRIGIFHGRFTQTPSSFGNIYEFHSFLRYYSGNRQIALYYPVANTAYAVTFDIEYVY